MFHDFGSPLAGNLAEEDAGIFDHLGGGIGAVQGIDDAGGEVAQACKAIDTGVDDIVVGGAGSDDALQCGEAEAVGNVGWARVMLALLGL